MKNKVYILIVCLFIASCGSPVPSLPPTNTVQTTQTSPIPVPLTPTNTAQLAKTPPPVPTDPETQLLEMQAMIEDGVREPDLPDLQYGSYQGQSLLLDIYLPDGGEGPYPVVIAIHGGGWDLWNKRMLEPWYYQFLDQGYALASIAYTLSDKANWPEQGKQVNAGVRWLKANAGELGLNPDKFIVIGGSAGGHLAGIIGTTSDLVEFNNSEYGNNNISSRVNGVITYYAPFDFLAEASHPLSKAAKLLGCSTEECPELAESASVISYVTPDNPPFYILHGTGDTVVTVQHARKMQETLQNSDVDVTLIILEGYAHGDKRFGNPENMAGVLEFVNSVFSE